MMRTCGICGIEFDDLKYSVSIDGADGVFDGVDCALEAASRAKRDERRAQLRRDIEAFAASSDASA